MLGTTKIYGCIDDPIDHVRAPDIYNERWIYKKQKSINDSNSCETRKFTAYY